MHSVVFDRAPEDRAAGTASGRRLTRLRRLGATTTEALLWGSLAVGIIGGTFNLYRQSRQTYVITSAITAVQSVTTNLRSLYINRSTYGANWTDLGGQVSTLGVFPSSYKWNAAINTAIGPGNIQLSVVANDQSFTILIYGLTANQCSRIANAIAPADASGASSMTINGINNNLSGAPPTVAAWDAAITTQCSAAGTNNNIQAGMLGA